MPTMLSLLLGKRKINFKDLIAKEVAELAWVPNLAKLSTNFSSLWKSLSFAGIYRETYKYRKNDLRLKWQYLR